MPVLRANAPSANVFADDGLRDIPIGDLLALLDPATESRLEGNTLVTYSNGCTVRVEVVEPEEHDPEWPIQAVVLVKTELPDAVAGYLKQPGVTMGMNHFAALGAVSVDRGRPVVGSRLTIFEAEVNDHVWPQLHRPLLLLATFLGARPILGRLRRAVTKDGSANEASEWSERDFARVEQRLSRQCFCNAGPDGITAELGLAPGAVSSMAGNANTALIQLQANQPHPDLGGGLLCTVQMPRGFSSSERLQEVCSLLNTLEMAAQDLVPHFGAWCKGKRGNNPAYVSFYPNVLHSLAPGIAVNAAIWAMGRAGWANTVLARLGR
jgi:hypothetical protein